MSKYRPIKTTNNKMRSLVQARSEFVGSNVFGTWETDDVYVVYSYGKHFPMYVFCWNNGWPPYTGVWYGNTDKYSNSTTRHQSQARPEFELEHWVNTRMLQDIIRHGVAGAVAKRMGAENG